jgi:hypothetical protein
VTKAALAQANAGATASGLDAPDSREADSGQARLHLPSRR